MNKIRLYIFTFADCVNGSWNNSAENLDEMIQGSCFCKYDVNGSDETVCNSSVVLSPNTTYKPNGKDTAHTMYFENSFNYL